MEYAFHMYNSLADVGMSLAMRKLLEDNCSKPVIVCIGSDLAIGDSLGPIVGTLLEKELRPNKAYIYGSLRRPVTAKEIKYLSHFLKETHPNSKVIAIDAAVGDDSEVGLVKVSDLPLKPGAGANKRLGKVGDISILGIIARKSAFSYAQLNLTRLNTVYTMAEMIARSVKSYLEELSEEVYLRNIK